MTSRREELKKELPDVVIDPTTKKKYLKGRFLGKVFKDLTYISDNLQIVNGDSSGPLNLQKYVLYLRII